MIVIRPNEPFACDGVILFAFGRGTYSEEQVAKLIPPILEKGWQHTVDYLRMCKFKPGESNIALADVAIELMSRTSAKLFVQWEIAMAMFEKLGFDNVELQSRVSIIWPLCGERAGDKRVGYINAKEIIEICVRDHGVINPLLVSHQGMRARVAALAKKQLHRESLVCECVIPYDPDSTQEHTVSEKVFKQYNLKAWIHHILHRWV